MKSNRDEIDRMVKNFIWQQQLADSVKVNIIELSDGCTKIEAWFPEDDEWLGEQPFWLPVAEYLFGWFGGDNGPDRFEHISMQGDGNGSYIQYVVR